MINIAVFGSTGSIGQQTLEVARNFRDKINIVALTAGNNAALLKKQSTEFQAQLVSIGKNGPRPEEIASHPDVDLVVIATSGTAGLVPTLTAICSEKIIALANKEVLVMAGRIIMEQAEATGIEIRPVDSEHSAIWQCLQGEKQNIISQILLTASGGPFLNYSEDQMAKVTPEEALSHPTWKMGRKVTIDSATLMNKGMEVIEAHWLFNIALDKIRVMIHPDSIVHSMVEFEDGSVKAQLGAPDMRVPIQYALSHPGRWENANLPKLDFNHASVLKYDPVDMSKFPCLRLAIESARAGETYPAVLSAVDEIAVELFLSGAIGFLDIPKLIRRVLDKHTPESNPTLDDILAADSWARIEAKGAFSR